MNKNTLLSILITAIITGSGVYFWQNQKVSNVTTEALTEATKITSEIEKKQEQGVKELQVNSEIKPEPKSQIQESKEREVHFSEYIDTRGEHKATNIPVNLEVIQTINNVTIRCSKNPDGACGLPIGILANANWELKNTDQTFYLMEETQNGPIYFGPFKDNVKRIIEEGKYIEAISSYADNTIVFTDEKFELSMKIPNNWEQTEIVEIPSDEFSTNDDGKSVMEAERSFMVSSYESYLKKFKLHIYDTNKTIVADGATGRSFVYEKDNYAIEYADDAGLYECFYNEEIPKLLCNEMEKVQMVAMDKILSTLQLKVKE